MPDLRPPIAACFIALAGCSGATGGSPADSDSTGATLDTGGTTEASTSTGPSDTGPASEGDVSEGSTGASGDCAFWVAVDGDDATECSETAPCRTVSRAIALATGGCTIHIGPGTYSAQTGELPPWAPEVDVRLVGAGPDTVLDDSAGTSRQAFAIECDPGESEDVRAAVVLEGGGLSELVVRGAAAIGYYTVLVVGGEVELADIAVEGGNEGIYVANDAVVSITDVEVSGAGHAAIKPGGDSVVTVERARLHDSKDALEPVCRATTTVRESEAYCNGNGLEALDRAHTTMIDNDIHHNTNGIAARGAEIQVIARGNTVHDNAFGAVVIYGALDAGTADEPGGNTFATNRFASLVLAGVPTDTPAIGNTWLPLVDGADAQGAYPPGTVVSDIVCSPYLTEIEAPPPDPCDVDIPVEPAPEVDNYVLRDGSCDEPPACGGALPACPTIGALLLGAP